MQLDFERPQSQSIWVATDKNIKKWLSQRQALLVLLYKLSVIKPRTYTIPTAGVVQDFCDILVDYVSAGHFDIFEKIINASQQNQYSSPDQHILEQIKLSTDQALGFCDNFAEATEYKQMPEALGSLSEALAQRFDLEDSLIQHYMKATDAC